VQGVDQGFVAEGFGEEANRSRPQRLLPCLFVPVGPDEDDGDGVGSNQVTLQLEAVHLRHRDIEDHAGHARKLRGVQEIAGRGEDRGTEPDRLEQTLESFADGCIIIHDCDESLVLVFVEFFHCGNWLSLEESLSRVKWANLLYLGIGGLLLGMSGLILRGWNS
jgi:hypothetical protein